MNNTNPISGITLEGFQVFDKPTYIPLERLTMLFGPNSAGKSAVQDAIELYAVLMNSEIWSLQNNPEVSSLLSRHWRRTDESDDSQVPRLYIGVAHTTDCAIHLVIEEQLDRKISEYFDPDGCLELECRWRFARSDTQESQNTALAFETSFEFYVQSVLVLTACQSKLVLNLSHPLISGTELKVDFIEAARTYPGAIALNEGQLSVVGYFTEFNPGGCHEESKRENWLRYFPDQDYKHAFYDKSSLFFVAIKELNLLVGCILSAANGNTRFKPFKVGASRTVPTRQDLTFQIGNLDDSMHLMPFPDNGTYRTLAESIASELTNIQQHFISAEQYQKYPDLPSPATRRKYADAVNHALADHLFMEQGYRLDYDFRLLMSKANSHAGLIEGMGLDSSEFGFLVELILRDGKGRSHLFEDVGSGIGYLLPVLCAVYGRDYRYSTSFIQQPELHIHPALQSAMGDVFIEGSGENSQILIETHSEHLLLRILKRIRQTHLQAVIAPELKIEADDVCVLYFDPSPDGATTVKRLRITEDGEFMDRWPRGFFGERDQELLDE